MGWELFKNYLIAKEKFKPDFFLYENNKSAAQATKEQICKELGVDLMYCDSALVSAQRRQRFYCFNWNAEQPIDRGVLLKDIIPDEYDFIEDNLLMDTFREWLSSYNKDRIRKILESFILKGMSQVDISKSLGITQPYVGRLLKVGVKDFKEYYYN